MRNKKGKSDLEHNPLSEWQLEALDMMEHGCGLSSSPSDMNSKQRKEMDDLVNRGLATVNDASRIYSLRKECDE